MSKESLCQRVRRRLGAYPQYWAKNLLYRWTPGGWGYYRELAKLKDLSYDHERDKHPVRHKHTGGSGWKEEKEEGDFVYRDYADYQEYIDHQKVKFDEMIKAGMGFDPKTVADMRVRFFRRFRWLPYHLERNAVMVCAGARQGTEVEVLHDIGFGGAYGTDLNPGPNNPWVRPGDFMQMDEEDSSVDFVYCNAIDHVLNVDQFLAEQARVIRPGGYAMYEVMVGTEGGAFEAVEWSSDKVLFEKLLEYFDDVVRVNTEAHWRWILLKGPVKNMARKRA